MNKIYQTIVDKGHGNCMQAAIASLLELSLEEVPNFIEFKDGWFEPLWNLLKKHGYEYQGIWHNHINNMRIYPNDKVVDNFHKLKDMKGIHGYFYAAVYSPKFYNPIDISPVTHVVIIDKNFNIVHDVNPEYNENTNYPEAKNIGYNGVIYVFLINPVLN